MPSEGVVLVPLRGSTTIGCRVLGGVNSSLVWSRGSSARFRTGSYSVQAHTITLPTIGLGDAGYYYCSATGPHNQTHTASIQVQVGDILTSLLSAKQSMLSLLATLFNLIQYL